MRRAAARSGRCSLRRCAVYALTVRFKLPPGTDWKALRAAVVERAHLYEGMHGLRSKAFVLDEASGEYGGNYVWESRAAAEAFVESQTFRGAVARFGPPEVRLHEVVAYLEGGVVIPGSVTACRFAAE